MRLLKSIFWCSPLFLVLGLSSLTIDNSIEQDEHSIATYTISQDSTFDTEKAIAELKEQIKGRENEPAEEVFKNIQSLKGVPAGRLLGIMKIAFNGSLGVNCTHCHNPKAWDSDEKPTKQITRDMRVMMRTINQELLANIENIKSERPMINCTTCHRGAVKPGLSMK